MVAKTEIKIPIENMDKNYPKYVLVQSLNFTIGHLKSIKRTRKTTPHFYLPNAEKVMEKRIDELRKAIKKLKG